MTAAKGVPVVFPSKSPDKISGLSFSLRIVDVPSFLGARRAINSPILSKSIVSPAGRLSITTPIPLPWLSPKSEMFIPPLKQDDIILPQISVNSPPIDLNTSKKFGKDFRTHSAPRIISGCSHIVDAIAIDIAIR